MLTSPKHVLYYIWKREIDDTLEQIVDQIFTLSSIWPASDTELGDNVIYFCLASPLLEGKLKAVIKILSTLEQLVNSVNMGKVIQPLSFLQLIDFS